MYIEYKGGDNMGSARIGNVTFSKSGKSIHYDGKTFETLKGRGYKANYFDVNTGERYWISGCKKDGTDGLYTTDVQIDEDIREAYWTRIRNMPEKKHLTFFKGPGKHIN